MSELYDRGLQVRREVMGDAYVDSVLEGMDDFNRDFQRLLTESVWGNVWASDGLSHKQRSLNNLCLTAALNRPHEFELHVRVALRLGCTWVEIKETLHQILVYAGAPAGVDAFRIARKVLTEQPAQPGADPGTDQSPERRTAP